MTTSARELELSETESRAHDWLRLFLIVQVVLGHIAAIALPQIPELRTDLSGNWPYLLYRAAFRFGSQSAYLFVFLSGFMVAGPLIQQIRRGVVPRADFLRKRFDKLLPISVLAVTLTLCIDQLARLAPGTDSLYRNSYAGDMLASSDPVTFLGNLAFLEPVVVHAYGSNGPLWTLGYIAQYYVIGWALSRAYAASPRWATAMSIVTVAAMAIHSPEWAVLFIVWFAGGLARTSPVRAIPSPVLIGGAIGIFVASNVAPALAAAAAAAAVGWLLTLGFRRVRGSARRRRQQPTLRRLSNDTFAVYAIHHPVLMAVFVVGFDGHVGTGPRFFAYLGIALLCALVVSTALVRISRMAPSLGRRRSPKVIG